MRNGNNNKRMRGRNRGSKGPNPLSRSYESNGPDVKIRGTAQHVAEKYLQLARDAHSSGDHVAAENYLQHAEHYFRIIAAAHEALRPPNPFPRADGQVSNEADESEEEDDDDFSGPFDKRFESPVFVRPEQMNQPRTDYAGGGGGQMPQQGGNPNRDYNQQNREHAPSNRDRDHNNPNRERFQGGGQQRFQGGPR